MAGRTDAIIKSFKAGAAIAAFTQVKFGAADDTVIPAAAATDMTIGATGELAAAIGERVDVHMDGIGDLRLGGNVTRGDPLTSDAQGRGVTAAPGAGIKHRTLGFALASGVVGDIAPAKIELGVMTG